MHLTPLQHQTIKSAVVREFGPGARIWLFGSRTDNAQRGGDIDLLIAALPDDDRPITRIARREGIRL